MENDPAASKTDSSIFPKSVRLFFIRIGDSEIIFLVIIRDFGSSVSLFVSTLAVNPLIL
jgi:hypothetical protein